MIETTSDGRIGRVIGMERRPNTAYTFWFWTDRDAPVGIGTLVKVLSAEDKVYGTVVEAHGFNDLESPLHEFLSVGGDPAKLPPTQRPEMRVYQAAVLYREPEEPVGAVPIGEVFLANEADVRMALRTAKFADEFGVPCGCYGYKDEPLQVHLDQRFLLGPEAGHFNMTGTSGLAAKTSYILFLLQSIFANHKDEEGADGAKGVAALLFNTKGGDLLFIDQADESNAFTELDRKLYAACELEAVPFPKVRYYAPLANDRANLNSLRTNVVLMEKNPTRAFEFGLADIVRHAEVLLNKDDLEAKADAYLEFLNQEHVQNEKGRKIGNQGEPRRAKTLDELCDIVAAQVEFARSKNQEFYESHHFRTMQKMLNRLKGLTRRFTGLIATSGAAAGPLEEPFEPGSVTVIDVARLGSDEQDLVFAAFITKLRERMEEGTLGVGKMIVVVDELNKYAPSGGGETYVAASLKEIAARGRYLGLTLFGAQQFRSRVDKEVVGNAATHAFGHVESEELAQPSYSHFSPAVKEKLGSLQPGEVLIKHPHFAQPIFVRFPNPCVMKGGDGLRKYPKSADQLFGELAEGFIKRLAPADLNRALDALAKMSDDKDAQTEVLRGLRRANSADECLKVLERAPRKAPIGLRENREPTAVVATGGPDFEEDPFDDLPH